MNRRQLFLSTAKAALAKKQSKKRGSLCPHFKRRYAVAGAATVTRESWGAR